MDETISRLNIQRFRELLSKDLDSIQRQTVVRLLAEEEARLKAIERQIHTERSRPRA